MSLKKAVKSFILGLCAVFVLIQFIQPSRSNPEFDSSKTMQAELQIPSHVTALLERGCKDCHSNETHWPWYSFIAPVSWLVANDVSEGRRSFNMSDWGNYKIKKKIRRLSGIYQEVIDREMPLPKYILMHSEANFSDAERDTLASWAKETANKLMGGDEE